MATQFGNLLKEWRETRKFSQMDLGLSANISSRHISFLETGRARPSRSMVLHLGTVLDIPRGSRNAMLHAAGFAPAYRSREIGDAEMAPINAALDWMLERHMPYPAIVLDRHWNVIRANATGQMMLQGLGLEDNASLINALTLSKMPAAIENWREVAHHMVLRLRTESMHLGGDAVLDDAAARLSGLVGKTAAPETFGAEAAVAARYRLGKTTMSFFSTISQFGTAEDIALADWKIEHFFPADEPTREMLISLADSNVSPGSPSPEDNPN